MENCEYLPSGKSPDACEQSRWAYRTTASRLLKGSTLTAGYGVVSN